jgi:hypothetical protein
MSVDSYTGEVYRLAEEILDDVPDDDIELIHGELKSLGFEGWCHWKSANRETITRYIESTPCDERN